MSKSTIRAILTTFALVAAPLWLATCSDEDDPAQPTPPVSEGATDSPRPVTPNEPRDSSVGNGAENISYYRFRSGQSGLYVIQTSEAASDLSWQLYTAAGFAGAALDSCDASTDGTTEVCQTFLEDANTDYFLSVTNEGGTATTFRLLVAGAQTGAVSGCNATATACFDFESGQVPDVGDGATMSGDAAWVIDDADATGNGTYSLRSGVIGDGQTSCIEFLVLGESNVIGFNYMTLSEESSDVLAVYVDDVLGNVFSGENVWNSWTRYSNDGYTDAVYKICFEKNGSVSVDVDAVWIDDLWFR